VRTFNTGGSHAFEVCRAVSGHGRPQLVRRRHFAVTRSGRARTGRM